MTHSGDIKDKSSILLASHQYFTTVLGGLVTNEVKMHEVSTVLDVGCYEGSWVLDLARQYPRTHVIGIDIDQHALSEATRFARFHGMSNATFLPIEARASLPFRNNQFDLVHLRSPRFLYDASFDGIMEEFTRILRPGGWLHLIGFEPGATSSLAFDRLLHLFIHTMHTVWHKTSAKKLAIESTAHLYDILLNNYFLDVSYTVHAVDFSPTNILGAKACVNEVLFVFGTVKSLVCNYNGVSAEEYEALLTQAHEEMMRPDMCGYGYLLSTVGCKNG